MNKWKEKCKDKMLQEKINQMYEKQLQNILKLLNKKYGENEKVTVN